ncbi:MAG: histidine kinase [Glaciecola sp.]|jgi:two-component system nitrate/nitrite sensor histidine kinase NarX
MKKRNFLHSTVFKIAALMFSISFLAVISMFSSVFISDGAQTDAQAVNVAGSLRMQSYRFASQLQLSKLTTKDISEFERLIEKFEKDLTTGVLVNQQALADKADILINRSRVETQWHKSVKPILFEYMESSEPDARSLHNSIQAFVDELDVLVNSYQKHAEANISTIRLIQSLALFFTLILIALAMVIVNRHIEKPLSQLTDVAQQIGRGDFTVIADESGKGELALLAKTINKMSASIFRSRAQLEEQVKRKTKKLSRSNESLDLLFQISKKLNEQDPTQLDFQPILQDLAQVTGVKDLDLCIMTQQGSTPYEHLVSAKKTLPEKCIVFDCNGCTEHETVFPESGNEMRYQLSVGGNNFGVLIVHPEKNLSLEDWQHQLFESVAEQIANGLRMKYQNEQNRRLALMNERTVIARELHDSLAQALSYLKIQVTRLQRLKDKENAQEQIDQVINELKNGLSAAYSELRELLTTFRLKLDGQGVKAALQQSISQLQTRSESFKFDLIYEVGNIPFSPQEEIHLLQIAREATQNAFYHSKGDKIEISLTSEKDSSVMLKVKDNGIGIPGDPSKLNHYGLAIMQERSRSLDGELTVKVRESGGTEVHFVFKPEYVHRLDKKVQTA